MEKSKPENDVRAPNLMERAKEKVKAVVHSEETHHKETHGTSDDIDENTPVDHVKAPGVFQRAKEEIEALVEVIHSKKGHDDEQTEKN